MDKALPWPFGRLFGKRTEEAAPAKATTRFGGDNDEDPVFVGTVAGPIEIEMAKDALREATIPAMVKQSSVGTVYGFTGGTLGSAEIWVPPLFAEQAYDILVGMGLIEGDADEQTDEDDTFPETHEM